MCCYGMVFLCTCYSVTRWETIVSLERVLYFDIQIQLVKSSVENSTLLNCSVRGFLVVTATFYLLSLVVMSSRRSNRRFRSAAEIVHT